MEIKFTDLLKKNVNNYVVTSSLFWVTRRFILKGAYNPLQVFSLPQLKEVLVQLSELDISNEKKNKKEISKSLEAINSIVNEMACNYNQPLIRSLGFAFAQILSKQFTGLHISEESLLKIKSLMGRAPVIFLPSHRSYCDFILMAFICFSYDVSIPCVAAGIDFKTMKVIGWLLSYCKAFFLRRSFSFDETYKKVFTHYIHLLVTYGNSPVEFFIEGTRSRTGKPLTPKFGLLKNILETYISGDVPDLIFVPVTLSYERILEDILFSYEVLGVPKPKESTSGFLKAVNMINERYGNVYVNFGEAISLRDFCMKKELSILNKTDCVTMMEEIAFDVVTRQQELQTYTVINVLCVVLNEFYMNSGSVNANLSCVVERMKKLIEFIQKLGAFVMIPDEDVKAAVMNCFGVHKSFFSLNDEAITLVPCFYSPSFCDKQLKGAKIYPDIMRSAVPVLKMNLYMGPLMYHLWVPASILILIRHSEIISKDDLLSEFLFLSKLLASEFFYGRIPHRETFEDALELLKELDMINESDGNFKVVQNGNPTPVTLVCAMYPAIITYECTYNLLCKDPLLTKSYHFILKESQNLVQERIVRKYHYHHASLSLDSVSLAIDSLLKSGALNKSIIDGTTLIRVENITFLKEAHHKFSCILTHFESLWIKDRHLEKLLTSAKL